MNHDDNGDNPYVYTITMGEMPSDGYSIKIVNIEVDEDDVLNIVVKEKTPTKNSVACVLTYPSCSVSIYPQPKRVIIKNTNGYEYKYLGD